MRMRMEDTNWDVQVWHRNTPLKWATCTHKETPQCLSVLAWACKEWETAKNSPVLKTQASQCHGLAHSSADQAGSGEVASIISTKSQVLAGSDRAGETFTDRSPSCRAYLLQYKVPLFSLMVHMLCAHRSLQSLTCSGTWSERWGTLLGYQTSWLNLSKGQNQYKCFALICELNEHWFWLRLP